LGDPASTFVTLLENIVAAEAKSSFPVAITFDDGNLSDAVIALPELAKLGLKAAKAIPTRSLCRRLR
jgi:peptidoglycan/xylan/chitin deacetylase (PgdA/CDA1 family)